MIPLARLYLARALVTIGDVATRLARRLAAI
jgi:hypothetical protein